MSYFNCRAVFVELSYRVKTKNKQTKKPPTTKKQNREPKYGKFFFHPRSIPPCLNGSAMGETEYTVLKNVLYGLTATIKHIYVS